jgi:hypothetical protein
MFPSFHPERIVLDANIWIARRQLAAEAPMRGRAPVVEQPGLREQKRADAHRAQASHAACHPPQPHGQGGVAHRPAGEPADQEHRVARALDAAEMVPGDERQHASLALHGEIVAVGRDFDRVDRPSGEAIDRIEHLQRPHEIELVDRWHDDDDDAAARGRAPHAGLPARRRHTLPHYASRSPGSQAVCGAMAEIDASVSQIAVFSFASMR